MSVQDNPQGNTQSSSSTSQADANDPRWTDIRNRLDECFTCGLNNNDWVFRGEPRTFESVLPAFDRLIPGGPGEDYEIRLRAEQIAMLRFRQHAPMHLDSVQREILQEGMQSQVVMRHYGAPTRLLDWTESPWVALFFASEQCAPSNAMNDNGRILAFSRAKLEFIVSDQYPDESKSHCEPEIGVLNLHVPKLLTPDFANRASDWVVCYHCHGPKFPRLIAQQSLFTMSSKPWLDHWATIQSLIPGEHHRFIEIPADLKLTARRYLDKMGITAASLFPGIDGVAQEISSYIKLNLSGRV